MSHQQARIPCGSWPTPISADLVVQASRRLSGVALRRRGRLLVGDAARGGRPDPDRPARARRRTGRRPACRANARSQVHEYGGGAWWVARRRPVVRRVGGPATASSRSRWRAGRGDAGASRGRSRALGRRRRAPRRSDCAGARDPPGRVAGRGRRGQRDRRARLRGRAGRGRRPARTSCPTPAGDPTGLAAGWSGTTRTCRGTPRAHGPERAWAWCTVAGGDGPDEAVCQPRWAPTARCGSAPTATAGGRSTAGRRGWGRADGRAGPESRGAPVGVRRDALRLPRRRSRRVRLLHEGMDAPVPARTRRDVASTSRSASPCRGRGRRVGAVVLIGASPTAEPAVVRVDRR